MTTCKKHSYQYDESKGEVCYFCENGALMESNTLSISELKCTLCHVISLIRGWNATETQWSEWDESVVKEVNELQFKIDKLNEVTFK